MNWNIFKRFLSVEKQATASDESIIQLVRDVLALRREVAALNLVIDTLERKVRANTHERWTQANEEEVKKRVARAAYARKYYAAKKAQKAGAA